MKIAILGHGVVGSGTAEILLERKTEVSSAAGRDISLKYIFDKRDFPELPYSELFTKDFSTILDDPEVGIVAEAMGGIEPAYSYLKAVLKKGKSAVTSNKELVAEKGAELLAIAREHGGNFLFEASVGGGIPIIRPLYQCLSAAGITAAAGILNGTTNYILTEMSTSGKDFSSALSDAQRLGYAEHDPSADVLGIDACRKIAILSSLIWGKTVYPEAIPAAGIDKIKAEDVSEAGKAGYAIKLIAEAEKLPDGKISACVSPMLIKKENPLASVNGVFNAVLIRAETTGDVLFYGSGAGKMPTASAMIADIIEAAKAEGNIPQLFWADGAQSHERAAEKPRKYFIRADGEAEKMLVSVLPDAEKIFEHAYFTPVLKKTKLLEAEEACGGFISEFPVFE